MKKTYMKKIVPYLFPILMSVILIYACDDSITANDLDNVVIPSSNVSYGKYIQPIFTVKCAMSGCHDDKTQASGVILTSYGFAVSDYSIISPGNPTTSKLVWAITGVGARIMPPNGVAKPVTTNQIAGIKTWIKEGAQNN